MDKIQLEYCASEKATRIVPDKILRTCILILFLLSLVNKSVKIQPLQKPAEERSCRIVSTQISPRIDRYVC